MTSSNYVMNNSKCTGCGACSQLCPANAIEINYDDEGFLKPYIDFTKCINCAKCVDKCPTIHPTFNNWDTPKCYAAYACDTIRKTSTSGGLFYCLAEHIIRKGGIVFGVAYSEDYHVKHIVVSSVEELPKICHTKYLQSNTNDSFSNVKEFLNKGVKVLFSGCPCQIAGLKSFLGKDYKNLYIVDILCMQVPPAPLFSRYLDETYGGLANVSDVQFRYKDEGWTAKNLLVSTRTKVATIDDYPLGWLTECKTENNGDGVIYHRSVEYDAYLKIFYDKLSMNSVCANCQFATFPRQGDISLGDFWGIYKHDEEFDDKGTNLILINNEHGEELFEAIFPKLEKCIQQPIDYIGGNRARGKLKINKNRDRFFSLLKKKSVSEAAEQCEKDNYDIGLVCGWTTPNYGGALTNYALYNVLEDMGYSVLLITHPFNAPTELVLKSMKYEVFPYPSYSYMELSKTITGLKQYNKKCETFLVGSDQLFNYSLYHHMDEFVNLRWAYDNKRKIAYAASFGLDDFYGLEFDRAKLQYFLGKYDFFSVREESGVEIAKKRFNREAEWVLDPVFLCDVEHYNALIDECKTTTPDSPYIFSYMLDINSGREAILNTFSKTMGISVYAIDDALDNTAEKKWTIKTFSDSSNNFFLKSIKNAKYVVTDSFHGMCFCIIFKKPFTVIMNSKRGSARMYSLTKLLGLQQRIITEQVSDNDIDMQLNHHIDFESVYKTLDDEKNRCRQWLVDALTQDIGPKALSEYDILDMRMDIALEMTNKRIAKMEAEISENSKPVSEFKRLVGLGVKSLKTKGFIPTLKIIVRKVIRLPEKETK